jgi:putative tryptophan/tyrosine transport system substrate-binding protein
MQSGQLRRREFLTFLGGAATTWPLAAHGQQDERLRRVGVLVSFPESDPDSQARLAALRDALQKRRWLIGGNLQVDYRWNISSDERARTATMELINSRPDLIFANATVALRAAQQATRTIPIVFTQITDPIGQGFVSNLPHPVATLPDFRVSIFQ